MTAPKRKTPAAGERPASGGGSIGGDRYSDYSTAPDDLHIYCPGARVHLDLTGRYTWLLIRNDGKRAVIRHPDGGTLCVPSWRVWLRGR